ncbi:YbaN family protein [Ferrimonas gelatinilytica]|uniref:YbaN family protein n=1 Tax=Ferrimonas gelatinilytica TaxID=1255257 RepID=A0ABP9S143_9GAMM
MNSAPLAAAKASPSAEPWGAEPGLVAPAFRPLLITLGMLAIALGSVGVVVPMLPTVPFLLLAAWCFSRASPRLRRWLFAHPTLGPYLNNFLLRKGLTRTQLHRCLIGKWSGMGLAIILAPGMGLKLALLLIAIAVSVYLLRLQRLPQ